MRISLCLLLIQSKIQGDLKLISISMNLLCHQYEILVRELLLLILLFFRLHQHLPQMDYGIMAKVNSILSLIQEKNFYG